MLSKLRSLRYACKSPRASGTSVLPCKQSPLLAFTTILTTAELSVIKPASSRLFSAFAAATEPVSHQKVAEPQEFAKMEDWSSSLHLRKILKEHGSNVHIVCVKQLRENFENWVSVVGHPSRVCYPVKTNPSPAILELMASWGARAECASYNEVAFARLAGFPGDRIVFGSPATDIRTAWSVLENGGTVVADSARMLRELDNLVKARPGVCKGQVFARVNPTVEISFKKNESWSQMTSHANKTGKFGIPSEEILQILSEITSLPVSGLHCHAGTQMDHVQPFVSIAQHLTEIAREIESKSSIHKIHTLDLGGGLGIPFSAKDNFPTLRELHSAILPYLNNDSSRSVWFEPGGSLVGTAVGIISKIVEKKEMRGRPWAIADVGTDQMAIVTLLAMRHQVLDPNNKPLPMEGSGTLGGPMCFAGDVLLPTTDVSGLEIGDPVFVQHAGAYFASLSNNFNGRRCGGTLLLTEDGNLLRVAGAMSTLDDPLIYRHLWGLGLAATAAPPSQFVEQEVDWVNLSSPFLKSGIEEESFEYTRFTRKTENLFEAIIQCNGPVDFVSLPSFARIIGHAGIVASLAYRGHTTKDFPVWATSFDVKMTGNIPSTKPIRLSMGLSHANTQPNGAVQIVVSLATDGGLATGKIAFSFNEKN